VKESLGRFVIDGKDAWRCLLHAPENETPKEIKGEESGWNPSRRPAAQSKLLEKLLEEWNIANATRSQKRSFHLPGARCGDFFVSGYEFSADIDLSDATFGGAAVFSGVTFGGNAWFHGATFGGNAVFHGATFGGAAGFHGVTFGRYTVFQKCKFKNLEYGTHRGGKLLFNGCSGTFTFADQDCSALGFLNMDLSRADFLGADISETRFDSCRWSEPGEGEPRYTRVFRHDEIIEKAEGETEEEHRSDLVRLKSLYRQLKNNLEGRNEYQQAGDFHYHEMEIRRMLEKKKGGPEYWLLKGYKLIADYGESYRKLLYSLIASFFLSTFLVFVFNTIDKLGGFQYLKQIALCWLTRLGLQPTVKYIRFAYDAFQTVLFGVIPSAFQKSAVGGGLNFWSKLTIVGETIAALILTTLFVMAIRRRFRR